MNGYLMLMVTSSILRKIKGTNIFFFKCFLMQRIGEVSHVFQ